MLSKGAGLERRGMGSSDVPQNLECKSNSTLAGHRLMCASTQKIQFRQNPNFKKTSIQHLMDTNTALKPCIRCPKCHAAVKRGKFNKHWAHTAGHRTATSPYPPEEFDFELSSAQPPPAQPQEVDIQLWSPMEAREYILLEDVEAVSTTEVIENSGTHSADDVDCRDIRALVDVTTSTL